MKMYVKLDAHGKAVALFKREDDTTEFVWADGEWSPTDGGYVAGLLVSGDPSLYEVDAETVARLWPEAV